MRVHLSLNPHLPLVSHSSPLHHYQVSSNFLPSPLRTLPAPHLSPSAPRTPPPSSLPRARSCAIYFTDNLTQKTLKMGKEKLHVNVVGEYHRPHLLIARAHDHQSSVTSTPASRPPPAISSTSAVVSTSVRSRSSRRRLPSSARVPSSTVRNFFVPRR